MNLKFTKHDIYLYLTFSAFSIFISYFVSNRDLHQVDDNIIYYQNFLYKLSINDFHYEFLFDLITFIIRLFTDSYIVYFFILNFILNFILFILAKKLAEISSINKIIFILIFFSLCLLSSWYQVAAANGLRQGLSLSFLYLFFLYFVFNISKFYSFFFIVVSIFFHYSSLLIIPFIFLSKLSLNKIFLLVNLFGLMYMLGFSENLVYWISSLLNIPLYDSIKNYIDDVDAYRYGFQWDLFLYSIGLAYIYYFFSKFIFKNNVIFDNLVKIYFVCLFPYFFYGFAAFSNRYGLFSWLFSILLNAFIFYLLLSLKKSLLPLGFFVIHFISILYFMVIFKVI